MRKIVALILSIILFASIINVAASENTPLFSVDAANQLVKLWNNYYYDFNPPYYCGYNLADDTCTYKK